MDVEARYAAWSRDGRLSDDDMDSARAALKDARVTAEDDIRKAAEAASYIVHTCRPTVRHEDEEVDEEELDGDVRSILTLFEGATVVRLKPRPPTEDDGIPFETDEQAEWEARMQAIQEAHEPGWAKRRLSAPYHPSERWDDSCRIAA